MKVNSDSTQFEGVEEIKCLVLAFVNYDFTEFFILFSPQSVDVTKDRNNILEWTNTWKKCFENT